MEEFWLLFIKLQVTLSYFTVYVNYQKYLYTIAKTAVRCCCIDGFNGSPVEHPNRGLGRQKTIKQNAALHVRPGSLQKEKTAVVTNKSYDRKTPT